MPCCFMTADSSVLHHDISRTVKMILQRNHMFFQSCRCSNHLKGRTRLVGIVDAFISPHLIAGILFLLSPFIFLIFLCQLKGVIQIKFRIIHHGGNLSILWIHHDNTDGICLFLQISLLCCLHGIHLDIVIQRGNQIISRDRLSPLLPHIVYLNPSCIGGGKNHPVLSLQIGIVNTFQSYDSLIVASGKPQYLRGQGIIRIISLIVLIHLNSGISIGKNPVSRFLVHITFDSLNGRVFFHPLSYFFLRKM